MTIDVATYTLETSGYWYCHITGLTGNYVCKAESSNQISIKGYDSITATTAITVDFYISSPASGEITTTLKSYYDSVGDKMIEEATIATSGLSLSTETSLHTA